MEYMIYKGFGEFCVTSSTRLNSVGNPLIHIQNYFTYAGAFLVIMGNAEFCTFCSTLYFVSLSDCRLEDVPQPFEW